ncbi:hypothetical protein GCM10028821_44920 [Hymenobacter jeollabukensis]
MWERSRPADERVQGVLQSWREASVAERGTSDKRIDGALRIVLDRVRTSHLPQLNSPLCALDGYCYLFPKGWSQALSATDLHLLGTATEFVVHSYQRDPLAWAQALRAHPQHHSNRVGMDDWAAQILHDYRVRHFTLAVWLAGRGLLDIDQ